MKTLRATTQNEILETLDRSIFTRSAFECRFNDGEVLIKIVFKDQPAFEFSLIDQAGYWLVSEAPGSRFHESETTQFEEFNDALRRIDTWLTAVFEELTFSTKASSADVLKDMRTRLNETADALPNGTVPFDPPDAAIWKERLDQLVNQVKELGNQQQISWLKVQALESEVANLKAHIGLIPKRTWVRSAGSTILKVMEDITIADTPTLVENVTRLLGP